MPRPTAIARLLSVLLVGCASLPPPPSLPGTLSAAPSARTGLGDDPPLPDVLRSGDELVVEVGADADVGKLEVQVDGAGSVHVGPGADVAVGGLTLEQAEARVRERLQQTDRYAQVFVRRAVGSPQTVRVFGSVAKPGTVPWVPNLRVTDAFAAARGVATRQDGTPAADFNAAVVLRDGKPLPIDMARALLSDPHHNVRLRPGDQLYVPFASAPSVTVFGQVGAPGVIPLGAGMRLSDALASAGGITKDGDKDDVRLIRGPVDGPKVFRASFADVAAGSRPDVLLAPDDILFVEDHPVEDLGEVLAIVSVFVPSLLLTSTVIALSTR